MYISAAVSDPCRALRRSSPVSAGSRKAVGANGTRATSPRRVVHLRRRHAAEPPVGNQLFLGPHPGDIAVQSQRHRCKLRGGPGTDVEPAEPPFAAYQGDGLHDLGTDELHRVADLDLPVIRRDHEHRPGRERLQEVTDEAIDRPHLVVVVLAQPLGVGDLVDAFVVGVDERSAAGRSARGRR